MNLGDPGTPLLNNYRGPIVAPHNTYRTHPGGYNDWCVIVCHSDEEWRRLVEVIVDFVVITASYLAAYVIVFGWPGTIDERTIRDHALPVILAH